MTVAAYPPRAGAIESLCPEDFAAPVVAAWGAGVNSTAMIIELVRRGEAPEMVLLAAMPEQPHTMALIPVFRDWMDAHGVANEIVEYQVTRVKHWPPYNDLLEACLTNGTLPSIAFGLHSCSARHKISPQDKWVKHWQPARRAWERGQKVVRLIGYDCSARDNQRYAHREGHASDLYHYRYPLREWGWSREDCERCIADAGLPPFGKSSCFFCTGMQPDEVRALPIEQLRLIVLLEARAAPRLKRVEGLWRRSTRTRPGSMTAFIRAEHLLDASDIDAIIASAPADLIGFQENAARVSLERRPSMQSWLDRFNDGVQPLAA
ncbi:hypothetical protein [Sphingobium sp. TCM1]|uniref:hypothetical protein n=1 Tax=Sphingobium sp. TCM1 TaxID=453246 RepID=UPI000A96E4B2|nr:hypothetical protein [Sphingobium sp. TCM1]